MAKHYIFALSGALAALTATLAAAVPATAPADTIYRNGYVYTVDAKDSVQQALAVRAGRIVYVGDNQSALALRGPRTKVIDLHGRMLMPGLIDAHMHPLSGGKRLLHCNLNYEALTVPQFQARIQACADQDKDPKQWLFVVNWFQQSMLPAGVETSRATLDALRTERPVAVRNSFGHSTLASTKALQLAGITRELADPVAGKIVRDASGDATGILEDAAMELIEKMLPAATPAQNLAGAAAALKAIAAQGVTTFLDADSDAEILDAFSALQRQGKLTARAHFAPLIPPEDSAQPELAVQKMVQVARRYDQGAPGIQPGIHISQAKLYMDGVIAAPSFTGTMVEPYWVNHGNDQHPRYAPGDSKGPPTYFPPAALKAILVGLAKAGIDPHVHVDGDGAVRETLDALDYLRSQPEGKNVRPGLAHDEIVHPADFQRFAQLDASAVLSFQWGKPAPDTVAGLKDFLGPERYPLLEPQAMLHDAGARIVFGSDWPVDALDEWFALKVAVTRTNAPSAGPEFAGTLGSYPGMTRAAVLRAATINAAYSLRQEADTGSLEVGKLADLIVLDRNFMTIPAEQIAAIKVLHTVVGGRTVYQAKGR
ncbi:MAG: amidohydrolase [Sphingomonadaceae bacterium]